MIHDQTLRQWAEQYSTGPMVMPQAQQVLELLEENARLKRGEQPPVFAAPRSPKWPEARAAFLFAHPTCAACGAKAALNVHHLKPYHLFPELELDPTNFLTLCESPSHNCHLMFGHTLNWTLYNADAAADAAHFLSQMRRARDS